MSSSNISVDPSTLSPTSMEVMANQATINIGTIGHVAHGKSTLVKAISGVQTVRFKNELERNITIKLGYANAKIYKCDNPECPRPGCYKSYRSDKEVEFPCERTGCSGTMRLLRHVSFVDCFGLDTSFATVGGKPVLNRNLCVGDKLMGPDGKPRTILSMKEGMKDMYEIAYKTAHTNNLEEDKFTCTGGHLLCLRIDTPVDTPCFDGARGVYFIKQYFENAGTMCSTKTTFNTIEEARSFYDAANKDPIEFVMTVESYLVVPESVRRKCRLYRASALDFGVPDVDLSVGEASEEEVAWLIGFWLSNGDSNNTRIALDASMGDDIIKRIAFIAAKMGLDAIVMEGTLSDSKCVTISTRSDPTKCGIDHNSALEENIFYRKLTDLGITRNKHVPSVLQRHSFAVRHAIVAGVVDAAGAYSNGQFDIELSAATGNRLFDSMVWMIRSLGFVVHSSYRDTVVQGIEYRKLCMQFNGHSASMLPIVSPHKTASSLVSASVTSNQFTVKKLGSSPFRGFEVDGDGHILLSDFIVAHNCPGHDILMATMLNGAAVMDAAMLLIAANESCPQPQTSEHLAAVEIMQLQHIIILQNKVDLIKEDQAKEHYKQIQKFTKGTIAANAPVVPISAQLKFNIDAVVEYIVKHIPIPIRDFSSDPRLIVIRSFDVNKPGAEIDELQGGVAGGSILKGVLKLGDEIEIRPGLVSKDSNSQVHVRPICSRILTLNTEHNRLQFAVPGGLIGVGTLVDPTLCRADRLVGQVLGSVGKLPKVYTELEVNYFLLRRLLGVKTEDKKQAKVSKLSKGEVLMINIGSTSVGARVTGVKSDLAKLVLSSPSCTEINEKIAMSRRIDKHWRLIGWAKIMKGKVFELEQN